MPGSPTPAPFYPPTHPEKSQFSSVTKSCPYSPLIVISHDSRNTGQQSPDPLPTGQVKTFPPTPARGPEEPLLNGPRTNPSDTDPPQQKTVKILLPCVFYILSELRLTRFLLKNYTSQLPLWTAEAISAPHGEGGGEHDIFFGRLFGDPLLWINVVCLRLSFFPPSVSPQLL